MDVIEIFGQATATKIEGGSSAVKIVNQEVRLANAQEWPAIIHLAQLLGRLDPTVDNVVPDHGTIFVAIRDAEIVGMVCCHQPTDGEMPISHLVVLEEHRHRGLGTALMQAAITFAGDKMSIFLLVNRSDRRLRHFYRRFGFKPAKLMGLRRAAT